MGGLEVPIEQYKVNLAAIFAEARKTGAEVMFTTTTPVPHGYTGAKRNESDVLLYNEAAKANVGEGVLINDLHGAVIDACPANYSSTGSCPLQIPGNVHFMYSGRKFCVEVVSKAIVLALAKRAEQRKTFDLIV